jgi:hypothetical protein
MKADVITGEALTEMRKLIESGITVDCCLADPPYGTTACAWDSVIPFEPMWTNLKQLVKKNGAIVLFGSQPFTSALVMSNPGMFKYQWVWNKNLAGNFLLAKSQPLKVHEDVCVFSQESHFYSPEMRKGEMRIKGGGKSNLWSLSLTKTASDDYYPISILDFPNTDRASALHPTQKPVELMRYLVRTYSNEGDTILDFTCGSGSTGVACAIENRDCILIDKDERNCEISRARILRAQGQWAEIPKQKSDRDLPLFAA